MTAPAVGNLSATLPPPDAGPEEIRSAAASGRLAPTDAVHPNGTVVFRLNNSTAAAPSNDAELGDELQFGMRQTEESTTPERLPLRLNTSRSGDAVRTFVVDEDRHVVVDLPNATWEYDSEPGTHALGPRPRVGQGYVATLTITANGTTTSRNTTIQLTEPQIDGDVAVDAGEVATLTVGMSGTRAATLVVGTEDAASRTGLRVVDEDADGMVRVRIDTGAETPQAAFTAVGADTVRPHPAADFTTWNGSLPPGEYRLGAGVGELETVAAERYDWDPVLRVDEPATGSPTPTATDASTPTQSPTPTETTTTTAAATTTDSPGFGVVPALLALAAVVFAVRGNRLEF
ncbi:DUF7827 domain-containing protein [Halolamina salina]|uniref:DUF7827 domain-containing protein n=1 Tax=Halolamina salina TaxID=1220023 RepID=A0ABD6B942_9EURY